MKTHGTGQGQYQELSAQNGKNDMKGFPVWMTVEIGGVDKNTMIRNLFTSRSFASEWQESMMREHAFVALAEKKLLRLVRCKVRDLGLLGRPTMPQIQKRVGERGGGCCPAELGFHLLRRLESIGHERCFLRLVMRQIYLSGRDPNIFIVGNNGDRYFLNSELADDDDYLNLDNEIVFVVE